MFSFLLSYNFYYSLQEIHEQNAPLTDFVTKLLILDHLKLLERTHSLKPVLGGNLFCKDCDNGTFTIQKEPLVINQDNIQQIQPFQCQEAI